MTEDNWKDRHIKMKCERCMHFVEKTGNIGRCRRHAPTMTGFPVVYKTDWCGDHKMNEQYGMTEVFTQ